jgi:hypothetical protein
MERRDILTYNNLTVALFNGTIYVVNANNGAIYLFGVGNVSTFSNLAYYVKSTNNGISWSNPVILKTGVLIGQISIWYDRWSGLNSDYIHVVYTDSLSDDTFYRNINTASSDALSAEVTIFLGASTASRLWASISVARGGNIYCLLMIDGGTEETYVASTDNGATWTTRTMPFNIPQFGQWFLLPSWNADNQDMMLIYLTESSTNNLIRYLYDDSADTWDAGTNILTGLVSTTFAATYKFFATVDLANSRNIISVWNRFNTVGAVLKCYTVTETTITAVTDVVASSGGNQAMTSIALNTATNTWYVFYGGSQAGTDTYLTSMKFYYKYSIDAGTTWSSEMLLSNANRSYDVSTAGGAMLTCTPQFINNFYAYFQAGDSSGKTSYINTPFPTVSGTITAG